MQMQERAYTTTAITMHWLVAFLIVAIFTLGLYMVNLPISPQKLRLYSYHKWIGVTICMLMAARLAWRVTHPPRPYSSELKAWERHLAGAVHITLYLLTLAIPVTGWLMSSAAGYKVVYLGILPLPDLIGKDKELAEFLKSLHRLMNMTLIFTFFLHVSGVLKHLIIDRDTSIAARMIPMLGKGD